MIGLCNVNNTSYAIFLLVLMASLNANASLLDCTKSLGMGLASGAECIPAETVSVHGQSEVLKDAPPTQPLNVARVGFQVDPARTASAVPESAPLLVLFGALLAVVLVRARSCNTK